MKPLRQAISSGQADLQPLALFDDLDEVAGFQQAVVGAGVEPGDATAQDLRRSAAPPQVFLVHVGDLQFATRRWA